MKKILLLALAVSSTAFSSVTMGSGGTYTVDHLGAVKKINLPADALKTKKAVSFDIVRKIEK